MQSGLISIRSPEPSWMLVRPEGDSRWFQVPALVFTVLLWPEELRCKWKPEWTPLVRWACGWFQGLKQMNVFLVSLRPFLTVPYHLPGQRLPAGQLWFSSVSWELRWSISLMAIATTISLPQPVWIAPRIRLGQVGISFLCRVLPQTTQLLGKQPSSGTNTGWGLLPWTKPI